MISNLLFYASQVIFFCIGLGSLFVAYEFWKSKNGYLRKIMILYFLTQFWAVAISGTYFFLDKKELWTPAFEITKFGAMFPLGISMALIWIYLYKTNRL